jgi:hypothetical protein
MFVVTTLEAKSGEGGVHLGVPCSRCLMKPIQSFLQPQHLIFSVDDEARWLPNINFLHQITIEKGRLHIHVMDPPSLVRCHCQNQANWFHSRNKSKNLIEIDPLPLHVAFRDKSGLVLDDAPMFILPGLEDSLEPDQAMPWWKLAYLPHLVLLY